MSQAKKTTLLVFGAIAQEACGRAVSTCCRSAELLGLTTAEGGAIMVEMFARYTAAQLVGLTLSDPAANDNAATPEDRKLTAELTERFAQTADAFIGEKIAERAARGTSAAPCAAGNDTPPAGPAGDTAKGFMPTANDGGGAAEVPAVVS